MDLDDVVAQCVKLRVEGHWVLFGEILAGGAMVVKPDDEMDACYFCGSSTYGRLVHLGSKSQKVTHIDACCSPCYVAIMRLDNTASRDELVVVATAAAADRRMQTADVPYKNYFTRLATREEKYAKLIARVSHLRPVPPAIEVGRPVESVPPTVDDLLSRMDGLLPHFEALPE